LKDYQARGYIFESIIWNLLEKFGYVGVETGELRGRGAIHQIDAYGFLKIPTPFIYPIRLLCEAKCYTKPIRLEHIRNYVGVIKDISENYIIGENGERNISNRYTDMGCYFSSSGFTLPAQDYAWAHNIFIISFKDVPQLSPIISFIWNFVSNLSNKELSIHTKASIVMDFWKVFSATPVKEKEYDRKSIAIGVLDGIYPIALVGDDNWIEEIDENLPLGEEVIVASKTSRYSSENDTSFQLSFSYGEVSFAIPNMIAKKIINKIDKSFNGDTIFSIDIPYISYKENRQLRRIFNIIVKLDYYSKEEYIDLIEKIEINSEVVN
jgi:hypothetical protein